MYKHNLKTSEQMHINIPYGCNPLSNQNLEFMFSITNFINVTIERKITYAFTKYLPMRAR